MAAKRVVTLENIGQVTLTKRKGNTNIRLSYARNGDIRVSLPYFVPYEAGIAFVKSKTDWLITHRPAKSAQLSQGHRIGKAHRLNFVVSPQQSARVHVGHNKITVSCPVSTPSTHQSVQQAAIRGAHKALKLEADQLLPQRLASVAQKYGFTYKSVTTKRLSSRWGSCSQNHDITLNIYLMQLPWHLIDYVIVHELVHTEHLNHSQEFWKRFEEVLPNAKALRKELKTYPTSVQPSE